MGEQGKRQGGHEDAKARREADRAAREGSKLLIGGPHGLRGGTSRSESGQVAAEHRVIPRDLNSGGGVISPIEPEDEPSEEPEGGANEAPGERVRPQ